MTTTPILPECSRLVNLDRVGIHPLDYTVEATTEECAALAQRFDLISVENMKATVTLTRATEGPGFEMHGHLDAHVVQKCIVTLDPVPESVSINIDVLLRHVSHAPKELPIMPDASDTEAMLAFINEPDIEYYEEHYVDLGEIVAQYMFIALDPYPRKPDAPSVISTDPDHEEKINPFAVLEKLKSPKN